jgi:hypothetical protein
MSYFDVRNYGGLKLRNSTGYFNTSGLPEPPPTFNPPAGTPSPDQTQTTIGGDQDKSAGGAGGVGAPPPDGQQWGQPSPNPYTAKRENFQYALDQITNFQTVHQQMMNDYTGTHGTADDRDRQAAQQQIFLTTYRDQFQQLHDTLETYGIKMWWSDPYGDQVWFSLPGEESQRVGFADVLGWLGGEVTRLGDQATRHDEFSGFMEGFQNWALDFEAGNVTVDPFADENGWGEMVKNVFGDMVNLPDMQDLLEGMYNLMPVWEYTADALSNLSAPERMTKFFDDLKANGFDMEDMEGGLDQELRNWLYKMAKELQPSRMFDQLDLDMSTWNKMTNTQIAEITKMLSRKSVLDDADTRKYLSIKMREIKQINRAEHNKHLGILAEKGIAHGGAMVRSAAELQQRLGDAEMQATADLFMRGIELAEQGKWEALGTFAQISATQSDLLLGIGGLKATLFGQYFSFLQGIGNISASQYATNTEAHIAKATLKLKFELGVAELEMDKFISEGVLNLEGLKLEYDNYWRDRGANLDEKQAGFDNAIAAWQTSAMMAEMVNSGRTERLVQMANLALAAQGGDREAWGMYQQLALRERLEQRGMDIDQAQALADLTWNHYQLGETMDLTRWVEQYRGMLQKELLRMGIQGEKELMRLKDKLEDDGFWGGIIKLVGSLAKLGKSLSEDRGEEGGGDAGSGGDGGGDSGGTGGTDYV